VDYTIRGVVVPAGTGTLEFIYRPASVVLGLWLAGLAAIVLPSWWAAIRWRSRQNQSPNQTAAGQVPALSQKNNAV
jgi:hypothetical protein